MKKTILLCVILFVTVAANAQFYVGGSIGVSVRSLKEDVATTMSGTSLSLSIFPEFGYRFNNRLDMGLSIGYGLEQVPSYAVEGEKNKGTNWEIAPYLRYTLVQFGKFSVLGRGSVYVGGTKTVNQLYPGYDPVETKRSYYGFDIRPVVIYMLSDHIDLLADLNFLSLNLYKEKEKDNSKATRFNFGANAGGAITSIGFRYKF